MKKILLISNDKKDEKLFSDITENVTVIPSIDEIENFSSEEIDKIYLNFEDETEKLDDYLKKIKVSFRNYDIVLILQEEVLSNFSKYFTTDIDSVLIRPLEKRLVKKNIEVPFTRVPVPTDSKCDFIEPFVISVMDIFKKMTKLHVRCKEITLTSIHKTFGDVSGIMGLTGDSYGALIFTTQYELLEKVVSGILGVPEGTLPKEEVYEGAGEVVNMIAGRSKGLLARTDYHFSVSLPTVVVGNVELFKNSKSVCSAEIIFQSERIFFSLFLWIMPKSND